MAPLRSAPGAVRSWTAAALLALPFVVAAPAAAQEPGEHPAPHAPDHPHADQAADQAADHPPKDGAKEKKAEEPKQKAPSVTHHEITLGGATFSYTATAGEYLLQTEEKKPKASVFYVSYVRDGVDPEAVRPVTFCFNGGPGSSSVWLHLGLFGPERVPMPDSAETPPPPYHLAENPQSLLDESDLVFIDPVTTGYSRAAQGENPGQFHGVDEDVHWVAEFIRLWVTRNERWLSPKFLAGESYGTTRAARLSNYLQDHDGMYLDGIVLISSILSFQTASFDRGNDLPYALFLPSYTATAWYHRKLSPELQADLRGTLDQVEGFALGDYTLALSKGDSLTDAQRDQVAGELARFTGLSKEYVLRANLRIEIQRFVKELMRDQGVTVGRLDSRFTGHDVDAAGERDEYDPSYAAIQGAYTALFNDYVRRDLGYESDLPYEILTGRVNPWSWGNNENRYLNVAEDLRQAMAKNPHLHVFVANGFFDLATPYFATEYTFHHMGLDADARGRVTMGFYQSGHMVYLHQPSLERLRSDLGAFYDAALPR